MGNRCLAGETSPFVIRILRILVETPKPYYWDYTRVSRRLINLLTISIEDYCAYSTAISAANLALLNTN